MTAFLTVRTLLLSRTVHILSCIVNWLRLSTFIKENDDDDDDVSLFMRHPVKVFLPGRDAVAVEI